MKEMWDKRFAGSMFAYGATPNWYFREKLNSLPAGKVLLICDGEGRNSVYAAYRGWTSVAMDYSEIGRAKALQLAEEKRVHIDFYLSPVETFTFPVGEFDAVGLIFVHFEPILRTYVHAQARKALKKGGKLIMEAFSKDQITRESGGPADINTLYNVDDLVNDFAGFSFQECSELEVLLNEGHFHVGMSNVVRIFATKL